MSKVKQTRYRSIPIVPVGGRDNIATVSHCITRLRFVLNDPAKANLKAIEELSPWLKAASPTPGSSRW